MSIGDILAEKRRQAGLTLTQVSDRTCIRETIIRGIERGDFSACGGDFYARGHIRSIARAVGADPEPLVRDYDATQGAPQAITAAEVFQNAAPIRIRERRRPNWSAVMALALAVIIGVVVWRVVDSHPAPKIDAVPTSHSPSVRKTTSPSGGRTQSDAARRYRHKVVIGLTASQPCWVQLTTASGQVIFSGMVDAGVTEHWTERHEVVLRLGNPGGVSLVVNGRTKVLTSYAGSVATLSFGPGQKSPG